MQDTTADILIITIWCLLLTLKNHHSQMRPALPIHLDRNTSVFHSFDFLQNCQALRFNIGRYLTECISVSILQYSTLQVAERSE